MTNEEKKYQEKLAALRHLAGSDGWEAICVELDAAIEMEMENLAHAEDPVSVMRSAGAIQALRKVMSIPDTYIRASEFEDPHN